MDRIMGRPTLTLLFTSLLLLPALGIRQAPDLQSFLRADDEGEPPSLPPTCRRDILASPCWASINLKSTPAGETWALLIAGSAGWGNYRHQADVCHVSTPAANP